MDEARYIREKNTVDAKAFNTLVYRTLEKELRELRRCMKGLGQGGGYGSYVGDNRVDQVRP